MLRSKLSLAQAIDFGFFVNDAQPKSEMKIQSAVFVGSFVSVGDCPKGALPEFAFAGRSNVGKSSLINLLCDRKEMVKISSTPGKTKLLNFFIINNQFHFVDQPGYGFAKVSRKERGAWKKMIVDYLEQREQLYCLFVLIDSSIPPQQSDLDFIHTLGEKQIPFAIVFTKADKESGKKIEENVFHFNEELKKEWEKLPESFHTSAVNRTGTDKILKFIENARMISESNSKS